MTSPDPHQERPIIVAIDFSASAREALHQGAARAQARGARLVLLHVAHRPVPLMPALAQLPGYHIADEETLRTELMDRLAALVREESLQLGAERVQIVVDFSSSTYAGIVAKAEELAAQLVVVGHRGDVALTRLLLGSVAQRVARSAPCPVLVARSTAASERLLVTTDFSEAAQRGVDHAATEARACGFEVILHHNLELPSPLWSGLAPLGPIPPQMDEQTLQQLKQAAEQLLNDELQRSGLTGTVVVTASSSTDEAIVRVAEQHRVALIVMASHGRSGVARMALGSVTESVLLHAHCSVLAVRSSQN